MRMKMNTSLSGPTVNVAPGGVHVCSAAEAIRHYRAGHGTPTEDCAEEFKAALAELEDAEQEIADSAASAAAVLDSVQDGAGTTDGADEKGDAESETVITPAPAPVTAKPAKPAKAKA